MFEINGSCADRPKQSSITWIYDAGGGTHTTRNNPSSASANCKTLIPHARTGCFMSLNDNFCFFKRCNFENKMLGLLLNTFWRLLLDEAIWPNGVFFLCSPNWNINAQNHSWIEYAVIKYLNVSSSVISTRPRLLHVYNRSRLSQPECSCQPLLIHCFPFPKVSV